MSTFSPCNRDFSPNIEAAHQAGVVIVAHVLGLEPRYADILPHQEPVSGWTGSVNHEPLTASDGRPAGDEAIGKVMLLLGGWVGEQWIGGDPRAALGEGRWQEARDIVESSSDLRDRGADLWMNAIVRLLWLIFRHLRHEATRLQGNLICMRRIEADRIRLVLGDHWKLGTPVIGALVRLMAGGCNE